MSRQYHTDDFFVDTGLLRDHVSKLREQRKNAFKLHANITAMRNSCPPSEVYKYNSLLRDIDRLIAYFDRMAIVLSKAEDEAEYLSRKMGRTIEEDTQRTRHAITKSLML